MESESNKGKTVILDNGFKYTKYYTTEAGVDCWHCTTKYCNTRITNVTVNNTTTIVPAV